MNAKEESANLFCSSHPDVCCPCCEEFQGRIQEEKNIYMENEKEWQKVLEDERARITKAAEPLLEEIEKMRKTLNGIWNLPKTDIHGVMDSIVDHRLLIGVKEALSSSAQVVEKYKKKINNG